MTLPIPTNLLTAGESAKRQAELNRRNAAYTRAIAMRRSYYELARRAKGTSKEAYYNDMARRAGTAERGSRGVLTSYQPGYSQFKKEYTKLTGLDKANAAGSLDDLLGKLTPYDPQAAAGKLAATRSLNDTLAQLTASKQQLAEDYATNSRAVDLQQPNDARALLSNYAGRGMAYSSGYGTAAGNSDDAYARTRAQLSSNLNRGNAQASLMEGSARSNYLDAISMILANTTSDLSGQAGGLGLGNSDVPYLVELARRRLAKGGT